MMFCSLQKLCNKVYYYDNIAQFAKNIKMHQDDLVFTTYYGKASASSKALIPAICEAMGIKYVGADSYAHMLCNDKFHSKRYALEFGIKGSNDVLVRDPYNKYELSLLSDLRYPVVVKPNFGGGSTGISQTNKKDSFEEAKVLVKQLFQFYQMPILVEEYIEGHEAELIIYGGKNRIVFENEVGILVGGTDYFSDFIWGFETKKIDDSSISFIKTDFFKDKDIKRMINLFNSFEKMDYMRIDCRINKNGSFLIELSPDCYLGMDGAVFFAFKNNGYNYLEMLNEMIQNSL